MTRRDSADTPGLTARDLSCLIVYCPSRDLPCVSFLSHPFPPCRDLFYHVLSRSIGSAMLSRCRVVRCRVLSCRALPCRALSCPVVSPLSGPDVPRAVAYVLSSCPCRITCCRVVQALSRCRAVLSCGKCSIYSSVTRLVVHCAFNFGTTAILDRTRVQITKRGGNKEKKRVSRRFLTFF